MVIRIAATKDWDRLSDEQLMQLRVRDLGVQIPGSPLEPLVQRLYAELDQAGIDFHPPCYLADEWLCPDRDPIIGIPFYLAHPRLKSVEQKMMFEVEGGTDESCMKLLRHEAGHAFNYAYELYKRTRWRQLFGPFGATYFDSYSYRPYSRRFVAHLEDGYAQSHPDEDFAETFAVWLAPNGDWEKKYCDWPVIGKLRYVDGLVRRIAFDRPKVTSRQRPPWAAARMTSTLAAFYERRRKALGSEFQGYYDDSLCELFPTKRAGRDQLRASKLLRQHRRRITDNVTRWTGHRKYDIHRLVNRFIARCDAMDLYAGANGSEDLIGVTALLTTIASNTLGLIAEGRR